MNTELVRAVFDCGIDDLRLLDETEEKSILLEAHVLNMRR